MEDKKESSGLDKISLNKTIVRKIEIKDFTQCMLAVKVWYGF